MQKAEGKRRVAGWRDGVAMGEVLPRVVEKQAAGLDVAKMGGNWHILLEAVSFQLSVISLMQPQRRKERRGRGEDGSPQVSKVLQISQNFVDGPAGCGGVGGAGRTRRAGAGAPRRGNSA